MGVEKGQSTAHGSLKSNLQLLKILYFLRRCRRRAAPTPV
ncbi:hypothetical protein COO91_10607 (plasmid) [Nostoc flagelliforme CCNUN1]|uniref:Uncharacterized protein n=1 Tax=Nostoc flagelliforme CCNUN1 TaxID=2038116 RepID=A0A2K8T9L3_9NOSO|nr:hypothetical protein COO91_10607 [Nostoc flagelliforme CCNUN1]